MQYRMYQEKSQEIEAGEYLTYGICYGSQCISDISTNSNRVKILVEQINQGQLNPYQLGDVIEDFFAE